MMFWQVGSFALALLSAALGFIGLPAARFPILDPSIGESLFYTFCAIFLAIVALDLISDRVRHRTRRAPPAEPRASNR